MTLIFDRFNYHSRCTCMSNVKGFFADKQTERQMTKQTDKQLNEG